MTMNTNQTSFLKQFSIILKFPLIDGSKKSTGFSFAVLGVPLIPKELIQPSKSYQSNKTDVSVTSLKSKS